MPGYLIAILTITVVFSCNTESKKTDVKSDTTALADTTVKPDTPGIAPALRPRTVYTMLVRNEDFRNIFQTASSDDNIRMAKFRVINHNGGYKLEGYGTDQDGNPETGPFQLTVVETGPTVTVNHTIGYEQMLFRGKIKKHLSIPATNRTYIRNFKDVWLIPCQPGGAMGDTVVYVVAKPNTTNHSCEITILQNQGGTFTNPSPPGNPCGAECDEQPTMRAAKK